MNLHSEAGNASRLAQLTEMEAQLSPVQLAVWQRIVAEMPQEEEWNTQVDPYRKWGLELWMMQRVQEGWTFERIRANRAWPRVNRQLTLYG